MIAKTTIRCLMLVGLAAGWGCGESKPVAGNAQTNDTAKLASLVTEFADTGTNITMLNYFTKGAKISPAEHKKYVSFSYQLEGSPTVSGENAKGSVKILGVSSGKVEGTLEWKFAKEKDIWKIVEAPLP